MKNKLNLLILDDNLAISGPLTKYLNNRFGSRINLSVFIDGNECIRNIGVNSHVLILNYAMKGEDLGAYNRGEIFRHIKKQNPTTEVTMLTSKQNVLDATEEIKTRVGDYIRKKERYLYDVLRMIDRVVLTPINVHIVLPVTKLIKDYSVIGYVLMILAAFGTVGVLVMGTIEGLKLLD
jgi:DNA-binding NtrC family response regulator